MMKKEVKNQSLEKSECFKTFGGGLITAILESLIKVAKFDKEPVETIEAGAYNPKKK